MINSEYLIEQTNLIFDGYRSSKDLSEELAEQAYMSNEQYADLRFRLKSCVFDLKKACAYDDDENVKKLEIRRTELSKQLESVKASIKIIADKYKPKCEKCFDEGVLNGDRCTCYYQKMNDQAYRFLGLTASKLHKFSENALQDEKTLKLIEKFEKYCKKFGDSSKNLMFLGQRGTGKTFLAEAIADRLLSQGKNALVLNAFALNDAFIKMTEFKGMDYLTAKNILTTCDLLVIDDLGAAPVFNKITAENLLMVVSEREAQNKPYIITTNLTLDEISLKFGERIFSRTCGKDTVKFKFDGKDLRVFG